MSDGREEVLVLERHQCTASNRQVKELARGMIAARSRTMNDSLLQELNRYFGFDRFLPGQRELAEHLYGGKIGSARLPHGRVENRRAINCQRCRWTA
jgi:hypothetical protein